MHTKTKKENKGQKKELNEISTFIKTHTYKINEQRSDSLPVIQAQIT